MVINTVASPRIDRLLTDKKLGKTRITVFHCFNALSNVSSENGSYETQSVKMPCSSMTREVFLLRAFEAGADVVIVLACPEGSCRYMEGNIRAGKRVARMKKLLDDIGFDGRRLNIFQVSQGDRPAVERIIQQNIADLAVLEPDPVA